MDIIFCKIIDVKIIVKDLFVLFFTPLKFPQETWVLTQISL